MLHNETITQGNHQPSSSSPHPHPASLPQMDEEGIEIRRYIVSIVKQWRVIVGLSLACGLLALIFSLIQPTTYSTAAGVTLLNIRSEVIFDETFTTVPLELATTQQDKRGQALAALAENPSLLNQIYTRLRPNLTDSTPRTLESVVEARAVGDFLQLQVRWSNPEDAVLIANEWAQQYVETANKAYVSTTSNTPEEARVAAQEAFAGYQAVQKEYEGFVAENDLDVLQSNITELDALLAKLRELKTNALVILNSSSAEANTQLVNSTSAILQQEIDQSIRRETAVRIRELRTWYTRRDHLIVLRETLNDIKSQLDTGTGLESAITGDFLAVMLARAGLLQQEGEEAGGSGQQLQLQIDLGQLAASGSAPTAAEVESLLETVNGSITRADQEIDRISEQLFLGTDLDTPTAIPEDHTLFTLLRAQVDEILNSSVVTVAADLEEKLLPQTLIQLSAERQALQAQLEATQARQRELLRNRDAAWELYTTLDNKAREAEAQFATGAPQVRLAVPAIAPLEPDPSSTLGFVLAGMVIGVLLALLYIAAQAFWSAISETATTPPVPLRDPQPAGD